MFILIVRWGKMPLIIFFYSINKLPAHCLLSNCKLYRGVSKKTFCTSNNGTKGCCLETPCMLKSTLLLLMTFSNTVMLAHWHFFSFTDKGFHWNSFVQTKTCQFQRKLYYCYFLLPWVNTSCWKSFLFNLSGA